ncbi:nitroreductase family protein [Caenimonas soli]|uniref:nitroreductase family protein n=1 Tax=Caenimonas soli TaxID=2735555 RepID=UPI001556A639|nr:nitroreductase [Caenimonas soli]NPC59114.1 nitroreductase [Caenimonas soli]
MQARSVLVPGFEVIQTGELMRFRRTIRPKRLAQPGPNEEQVSVIVEAASWAPDHGELTPWRFVLIPHSARHGLGLAFAQALLERDPLASEEQLANARQKATRSPVLMVAICRCNSEDEAQIPAEERLISLGCGIQNMLLMATAMGFGSALTSGKAMRAKALREFLQISPEEEALCFLNFGSVVYRPPERRVPHPSRYFSTLES